MSKADGRRLPALYVVSWSAVFLVAAAYLTTLLARPDKLADFLPPQQIASGSSHIAPTGMEETEALRRQIAALETDRTSLRLELARRTDHEANLTQRLAALEQQRTEAAQAPQGLRLVTTGKPEAAPPEIPVRATTRAERLAAAKARDAVKSKAQPAPAQVAAKTPTPTPTATTPATKIIARAPATTQPIATAAAARGSLSEVERLAEQSQAALRTRTSGAAIETGSVPAARPPVAFGPPNVTGTPSPSGAVGVRLGTGPSVDALRMTWGLVNEKGRTTLDRLQPRYMASTQPTAGGTAYDLVAGPLPNTAEAQRVCEQLRAQKLNCSVGAFGGNAL